MKICENIFTLIYNHYFTFPLFIDLVVFIGFWSLPKHISKMNVWEGMEECVIIIIIYSFSFEDIITLFPNFSVEDSTLIYYFDNVKYTLKENIKVNNLLIITRFILICEEIQNIKFNFGFIEHCYKEDFIK
jgi:hypothetical protein